jgi:ribosomal protein L30E
MATDKDVKNAVKEKKLLIGSRGVLTAAKTGKISSLIYASNTPRSTVNEITHYVNISGIKIQEYPGNSMQLGELAGKPFSVLLLGIKK